MSLAVITEAKADACRLVLDNPCWFGIGEGSQESEINMMYRIVRTFFGKTVLDELKNNWNCEVAKQKEKPDGK